jgi:ADP-heptose:LPS heptosyltransferase
MKERNLYRLSMALRQKQPLTEANKKLLCISPKDKNYINALLENNGISTRDKIVIVSPATGGRTRRWGKEKFADLCEQLANSYSVILIGKNEERTLTEYIKANCTEKIFDFASLTNLAQLVFLLEKSSLVVACDTGILHLASYLDIPVVGIFGPSDEQRYGPWSSKFKVITEAIPCRPCRRPDCKFKTVGCMREISVNKVLDSIDALLKSC